MWTRRLAKLAASASVFHRSGQYTGPDSHNRIRTAAGYGAVAEIWASIMDVHILLSYVLIPILPKIFLTSCKLQTPQNCGTGFYRTHSILLCGPAGNMEGAVFFPGSGLERSHYSCPGILTLRSSLSHLVSAVTSMVQCKAAFTPHTRHLDARFIHILCKGKPYSKGP